MNYRSLSACLLEDIGKCRDILARKDLDIVKRMFWSEELSEMSYMLEYMYTKELQTSKGI